MLIRKAEGHYGVLTPAMIEGWKNRTILVWDYFLEWSTRIAPISSLMKLKGIGTSGRWIEYYSR